MFRTYISTSNKTNANGQNILVPLSAVATTQEKLGASQINRRDLEREVLIEANTSRTSKWGYRLRYR